jgi:uncharacterized protein YoxC
MEDRIQNLLQDADRMAGRPRPVSVDLSVLRRRARQRRFVRFAVPASAAAAVLVVLGLWAYVSNRVTATPEHERIASLENQVKALQARTDAALKLVHEVLEDERRQRRLDELQAELASIGDPLEEIREQVDKTAFMLVYQADRMYRELGQKRSAVQIYRRVIDLFAESPSAEVARQRLSEIRKDENVKGQIQKEI